jgi:hypothetical protein
MAQGQLYLLPPFYTLVSEVVIPFKLHDNSFVYVCHLLHACYMSCSSRPP